MSIYLKGDGQIHSSIAFNTIVLPNPAISPDILEDNVDIIEGDSGQTILYEKGTALRIFPYQFTLIPRALYLELWTWWQKIKGQLHWFWLQPYEQYFAGIVEQTHQSDTLIYDNDLGVSASGEYNGASAIILQGNCRKQARKIIGGGLAMPYGVFIEVSPAFSENIAVGTKALIGYPVSLDENQIEFVQRMPEFWDVNLVFREKLIDLV